jgi:hypothetical protein
LPPGRPQQPQPSGRRSDLIAPGAVCGVLLILVLGIVIALLVHRTPADTTPSNVFPSTSCEQEQYFRNLASTEQTYGDTATARTIAQTLTRAVCD